MAAVSAQRTPGPFRLMRNDESEPEAVVGKVIRLVGADNISPGVLFTGIREAEANAAFVLSALNCHDDLLSVLDEFLACSRSGSHIPSDLHARAEAAIAKARGGAS